MGFTGDWLMAAGFGAGWPPAELTTAEAEAFGGFVKELKTVLGMSKVHYKTWAA